MLDPAVVEQLQALAQAGNAGLLDRLQASFARDTPVRLQALRAALAAGDADAVAFNIHTLKGSAANLGAVEVVELCGQIESLPAPPPRESSSRCSRELEHERGARAGRADPPRRRRADP